MAFLQRRDYFTWIEIGYPPVPSVYVDTIRFFAPFMIPWKVDVTNPPPIIPPPVMPPPVMPPPVMPPVPLMVITPPFIWNVICVVLSTGPPLPIICENVSFPLASTTECPYVQSREPGLPEDTECITQYPIASAVVPAVSFIMTHNSGLPPLVSVATIMDLSIDMTP